MPAWARRLATALVVPQGPLEQEEPATEAAAAAECEVETVQARPGRISWARLLKRVFDIDMQHWPNCGGGELKIIAAILERPVIEKILTHLALDPQPPPRGAGARDGARLKPPEPRRPSQTYRRRLRRHAAARAVLLPVSARRCPSQGQP